MRRLSSLLVAAAAVLSVAVSVAFGGSVERFNSTITLRASDPFHGKVTSQRAACQRGRRVSVFRVDPGADGLFGSTTTNPSGRWTITAGMPNGDFYAVVKRRSKTTAGTTFICRRARSKNVHFGM